MQHQETQDLERWLAAEAGERASEAEKALGVLLRAMPRVAPPPGFDARLMARAQRLGLLAGFAAAVRSRTAWGWRALSAAAVLFASAVLSLLLTQLRGPLLDWLRQVSLTDLSVRAFGALGQAFQHVAAWRQYALDVNENLSLVLQTPSTALLLVLALGVSCLALRALSDVVARDRSPRYAHAQPR